MFSKFDVTANAEEKKSFTWLDDAKINTPTNKATLEQNYSKLYPLISKLYFGIPDNINPELNQRIFDRLAAQATVNVELENIKFPEEKIAPENLEQTISLEITKNDLQLAIANYKACEKDRSTLCDGLAELIKTENETILLNEKQLIWFVHVLYDTVAFNTFTGFVMDDMFASENMQHELQKLAETEAKDNYADYRNGSEALAIKYLAPSGISK